MVLVCHVIAPDYYGLAIGALVTIAGASALSAYYEENRVIPAIVWNIGLAILAFSWVYFLYDFFFRAQDVF